MTIEGHSTCPHCSAIVSSTICAICGKSSFEAVAKPAPRVQESWWQRIDRTQAIRRALALLTLIAGAGATYVIVAQEEPPPEPAALPAPQPTTTTTTTPGRAPTIEASGDEKPPEALAESELGVDRSVGLGLSPWESTPPIDFVTGEFFDEDLDYAPDILRVEALLAAFPTDWSLEPIADTGIVTFVGSIDLDATERTQPFAARTIVARTGDAGTEVGELWLIASSGSVNGDAYLSRARDRWRSADAVEQYAPEPGLRIWQLGADTVTELWMSELDGASLVIIQVPLGTPPSAMTTAIAAWRSNLAR